MQETDRTKGYDISQYLNIRSAYYPSIAPDEKRIVFITDITGVPQAWQVQHSPGANEVLWPDQLTFGEDRVMGVWCSGAKGDDRVIFARDVGGDEKQQLYLLRLGDATEVPLTVGHEGSMHLFGEWSSDGAQILFAANRRDLGLFDLYLQPLDGKARLVWENTEPGYLRNISFSPDGEQAIVTRMSGSFRHELIEVDLASGAAHQITLSAEDTRFEAVRYAPGGRSLFLNTDLGSDFLYILRLDLEDMSTEPIVSADWDVELMTLSPNSRYLAYVLNVEGISDLKLFDLSSGATRSAPSMGSPPGVVGMLDGSLTFSPDSVYLAYSFTSATRASDLFVWDLETDQVQRVTRSAHGGIPLDSFASPELVHYPTFDTIGTAGTRQIPAWFYRPPGHRDAPMPIILVVHGGPEGQFRLYLNSLVQYFLSRGYGVLAPNVRGSSGYGKRYCHLDDVEKRMDSVADLAHAALWLKEQPDVDSDRLVVYGASYGGFMVLSALCTYPDLWAAGVDIVGISSFVTFLENTSGYRRTHRQAEYGNLETDREFLESVSPINHIEKLTAPLIVIHGANDPRVPLGEAEQLVDALHDRGVPVELLIFDDEGHGVAKLKNKMVAYPAIASFLDRHLGGGNSGE